MRELPLAESPAVVEFVERLLRHETDLAIFLTGVGTRLLVDLLETHGVTRERLAEALSSIITVVRGPKPRAVLAELGVRATVAVPEPNTWRELLAEIGRASCRERGWRWWGAGACRGHGERAVVR